MTSPVQLAHVTITSRVAQVHFHLTGCATHRNSVVAIAYLSNKISMHNENRYSMHISEILLSKCYQGEEKQERKHLHASIKDTGESMKAESE